MHRSSIAVRAAGAPLSMATQSEQSPTSPTTVRRPLPKHRPRRKRGAIRWKRQWVRPHPVSRIRNEKAPQADGTPSYPVLFEEIDCVGISEGSEGIGRLIQQSGLFRDLRILASSHKLQKHFRPGHIVLLFQRAAQILEWQATHGDVVAHEVRDIKYKSNPKK
jgi:hypothetical protein